MPYAKAFLYVTFQGYLGAGAAPGVEQWQAGIKLSVGSGDDMSLDKRTSYVARLATPAATFHTDFTKAGNQAFLARITAAYIGTDGKYVGGGTQATAEYLYPSAVAGTGTPLHPYATANAIGLRTGITRGRGSRGRFYWPAMAVTIEAGSGMQPQADIAGLADSAKTFLNSISGQAALEWSSGNVFPIVASNLGAGTQAYVTRVAVGRKPDHQERRERKIREAYEFRTTNEPPALLITPSHLLADSPMIAE